jgi:hypothetical protein
MSERVAVLFGRTDGSPLSQHGVRALNSGCESLVSALKHFGYSETELLRAWRPYIEEDIEGFWYYWGEEMGLKVGRLGCCLQTSIHWRLFLNNEIIHSACRGFVREIAICFDANMAIFAPDSSNLFNLGCSQFEEGRSMSSLSALIANEGQRIVTENW